MSDDDRRGGVRYITELSVTLLPSKGGEAIDDRAVAHDVSVKGFKVETQAQLQENMLISFILELPMGARASGKGRIVWANRDSFATWAGVEVVSMSWGDKRRLGVIVNPDQTNWGRLSSITFRLFTAMIVITAAHKILFNSSLRALAAHLAPKMIALLVMGWAFVNLMKKEKERR